MPRPSSAARACRTPAGCRRTRDDRRQSNPGPTGASRTRRARTTPAPARRACRRGPASRSHPGASAARREAIRGASSQRHGSQRMRRKKRLPNARYPSRRLDGYRHDDARAGPVVVAERHDELPGPGFGCTVGKAEQSGVVELDGHVEQGVQAVGPAKTRRLADLPTGIPTSPAAS